MSDIIPKEKLATFQRWQIGSFDEPKAPPAPKARRETAAEPAPETTPPPLPPQVNLPTAEELGKIYDEAHANGYQAGFEEGKQAADKAGRKALQEQSGKLTGLLGGLRQSLDALDQEIAEQLLALATEIASQVVRGTISAKEDVLLPIIREAIGALPLHHSHVTLRLNPDDAVRVRELAGEQLSQNGTQIIEDNEISPGGCLVRAGTSEVDASLETRWKRVLEAIGTEPRAWLNN